MLHSLETPTLIKRLKAHTKDPKDEHWNEKVDLWHWTTHSKTKAQTSDKCLKDFCERTS